MRKKIMIAEQSDAIRSIAETILHQNGYDVLTAPTIEKAKELIIAAKPNMVIIGADLKDAEDNYLYDSLDENDLTSSIPILIIADPNGRSLPYPDEVILPRPFNPSEFLERVKLFVGGGLDAGASEKPAAEESFPVDSVDDEFLDSALGVDNIEVEESEVLNQTGTVQIKKLKKKPKKKDVFDTHQPDFDEGAKSDKAETVESLLIRDEESGKVLSDQQKSGKFSTTSKIKIASNQYGLDESEAPPEEEKAPSGADKKHDYDWFIDEMKKEEPGDKPSKIEEDKSGLKKTPTSDAIEPVNPPRLKESNIPSEKVDARAEITPGGVDKFISNFKEEVERINNDPGETSPEKAAERAIKTTVETVGTRVVEKETDATLSPEQIEDEVRHICNNLVELLSEKLAKKIVDKIDKDEIYKIIQKDLKDLISGSK